MKILVTGGTGFIGCEFVRSALSDGHQVINVDCLTYAASPMSLAMVSDNRNYKFEKVDIRQEESIKGLFLRHQPDKVIHMAAESHVDRSIKGPTHFITTNINGTVSMLEAAKDYWESSGMPSTFVFHHVSTDEVFGSLQLGSKSLFTEETPYEPRSPYSASKAASDHLVRAWFHSYGLPITISNCSNNYGPYQYPEKLIPVLILNAILGKPLPIYGNGLNVRDWLFVKDHVNALLLLLAKGQAGRTYNIGGSNERSNLDVAKTICRFLDEICPKHTGSYSEQIVFVDDRPGHDERYAIDPSRIKGELGWEAKVRFETGLKNTIRWYLENEAWWRPLLAQ